MKKWVLTGCFCLAMLAGSAQQYLLFFSGKPHTVHSLDRPSGFLSAAAIERRQRQGLGLDSTDLPVSPAYLDTLRKLSGVTVLNASKWLNSVSVLVTDPAALQKIAGLPFILRQQRAGNTITAGNRVPKFQLGTASQEPALPLPFAPPGNILQYGLSEAQVAIHNGQFLHRLGLRGQGMRMGILDAGFFNYHTLPVFDSVRNAGRVLDTWDFVSRNNSVAEDNAHGMQCFSIIAGNIPGQFVGTAPWASFFLYRSEDAASETLIEEHNWVCAAERVDSAGGQLISSSLGYTQFDNASDNHNYTDLDGNTTIAARGADMAARKGILVLNAAGNSGNDRWKFINTPADGDSVLAVGAVDRNGQPGAFSSYGPSADGRIKPEVASVGVATFLQGTNGRITTGNGTSYATPNLAGLAACLWQGFPEAGNMQVLEAIRQSASRVNAPDTRVGYGIPDMKKAMGILLKENATLNATVQGCRVRVAWASSDADGMRYVVERKDPNSATFTAVGALPANAGTWGRHNYSLTDNIEGMGSGAITYRLMQVLDTSATAGYSVYLDTAAVSVFPSCALTKRFNIIPNPVGNQFMLQANFPEPVTQLTLVGRNTAGQQVLLSQQTKNEGVQNLPVNAGTLAAGTYFLQVYSGENLLTTLEFVKMH